ncbi:TetR/AcrR family transcriptional regulator [Polyangium jinanense]|uniref:TetR/AcrR family transcriptional regulator n=1 Tax=Polyangium jinanense TaxID=2829994 RepID=A0A9X3XCX8_9BACT|nr:TetR/AcrR family transcriptional regulator [Polyangium jinanense]MDC3959287.1 TetR/AcrR family transcriptional regulator [Polyangium jinanense]MDC3985696.1 TetR/AcrR family transcriptional regulator [Polyangium jinanense]
MRSTSKLQAGEGWQRAHSAEQKEQRREAILGAAADLFRERSLDDISIGEVAERAGLAKGSVYRYFATKEEVFQALFLQGLGAWFDEVMPALRGLPRDTSPDDVAALVVRTLAPREPMLRLLAINSCDIEKNLSLEAARASQRWMLEHIVVAGAAFEAALPALPEGGGVRAILRLGALVSGLWPMGHPIGAMKKVLAAPKMAPLRVDFYGELEVSFAALLAGMCRAR